MTRAVVLQEWITVSGDAGQSVTQSVMGQIDLGGYVDVAIFLQVASDTSRPSLHVETSCGAGGGDWPAMSTLIGPP